MRKHMNGNTCHAVIFMTKKTFCEVKVISFYVHFMYKMIVYIFWKKNCIARFSFKNIFCTAAENNIMWSHL